MWINIAVIGMVFLCLNNVYSQETKKSEYLTFTTEKDCKECIKAIDKELGYPNAVAQTYAKCKKGKKKFLEVFNIDCWIIEVENWIKKKPVITKEGKLKEKKDIKFEVIKIEKR